MTQTQVENKIVALFQNAIYYAMNEEWRRQYDPDYMDVAHDAEIESVLSIPFCKWPYLPLLGLQFLLMALVRRGHKIDAVYDRYREVACA